MISPSTALRINIQLSVPSVISSPVPNECEGAWRNLMSGDKHYYVYLLTDWNDKVMYIGVTGNLEKRIYEHKNKLVEGFSKKYNVDKLVYFEETRDIQTALSREKEIKKWRREKKNNLVITSNPEWKDLSEGWGI